MKEMLFNFVAYYQQVKTFLLANKASSNNRQRELCMIPSSSDNFTQQTQSNIITQKQHFMQTSTSIQNNNFSMTNFKSLSLTVSKVFSFMLVMLTFMFTSLGSSAQINYSQNFDVDAGSWTGVSRSTTAPCSGNALTVNLYSSVTTATAASPLIGTSTGFSTTLTYKYRLVDYSTLAATANTFGNFKVQYSNLASGGTWTDISGSTINNTNHTATTSCVSQTLTFTPPAGALYIRFVATWSAGDYYWSLDDISIVQAVPCVPPTAQPTALIVNPTTGTTNSITGSFTASSPASSKYLVVRTATNVAPVPTNGTAYTVGSTAMGTGTYVESNSSATTFTSTGLTAGTTYYYWVFSSSGNCVGESYSYLSLASEVNAAAPLSGSATTNTPIAPTCAVVSPASGTVGVSPFATIGWSNANALPAITGYDVYLSTNQALVEGQDASVKVLAATASTGATFTSALLYNTTYYWKVVTLNVNGSSSGCAVNSFVTAGPALPTCPTAYSPVTGTTNATATQGLSWTPSTNSAPAIAGYDLYVSSSFSAVQNQNASAKVLSNANAISFTPSATTILFAPNTTYYWMVISRNTVGPASSCVINSFTTASTASITSTATGGLWSSTATWVGGVVPTYASNVTIANNAIVTVDAAVTVNSLTLGTGSILQWNGTANAMTVVTNVTIGTNAKFLPYTSAGTAGVTLNIGGNFTNNGYTNLAVASTFLNFNGSQQGGGSAAQTLGGTGSFEGDTTGATRGIIRSLAFATNGASVINTTQNLVAYTFSHAAGSLNTNGKLRIDNSPQVYGQPINRKVASIALTAMGSGYTGAPVIAPSGAALWVASSAVSVGNIRVSGSNVYVVLRAGTTGTGAPTHTTDSLPNGGASLLWVGNTGTLGSILAPSATVTVGNQYFIGSKLFTMKGANPLSFSQTRDITVGASALTALGTNFSINSDTLIYIGTAATGTVNHDATTSTVRSISLTTQGDGYYTTAPAISLLATNAGSGATATAVFFQQIVGPANSLVTRGTASTITGGLNIVSNQSVTAVSTTGGGIRYTGTPLIGFPLPTGFQNLMTAQGSGYTSAPTVTVTGGSPVRGFTLPTFTVTVAGGKVVSVICSGAGTGFRTIPTLTLTGGVGTGATAAFPANSLATATAVLANGTITKFNVTNGGAGYTAAPTPIIVDTAAAFSVASNALTSRVSLYNLSFTGFLAPATTNPIFTMDSSVLPANNRINILTVGSTASIRSNAVVKMKANLELYAGSGALALPTATSYGTILDMNGYTLTCSHPGYAGAGTAGSPTQLARGYVTNGFMKLSSPGGSLTRTFPFASPFAVATGTGGSTTTATTGATGSTITGITVSQTAKPTATAAKFPIGAKGYKVDIASGEAYGTAPIVTLSYNPSDTLLSTFLQSNLYIGQASSLSGPWTRRSASYTTAAGTLLSAAGFTGARRTGPSADSLIVPASSGTDYYTWVSDATAPTVTGTYGPYCTGGGTSVTIAGTNFANVTSVKFNGVNAASYTVNSATSITAITPAGITAGVISVTANGIVASSSAYTITSSPVFVPSLSPANGLICAAGSSVSISLNDIGADSYTWTGGTGLDTYTGLNVVASPAVSTAYTVTGTISSTGCVVNRTFNIGVIPSAALAPSATPSSSCFVAGSTINLNSNLSAGNFSVASIPYAPATVPANVNYLVDRAAILGLAQNGTGLDDNGFINVPMGFNYNFFGTFFDNLAVGTNSTMMFGTIPGFGTADGELSDYTFTTTNGVTFPNEANAANVISLCSADMLATSTSLTGITGTITTGSPNITITNGTIDYLAVGDSIIGTGVGTGAKIASISGNTVVMTVNSTASASGVALTYYEKPSMRYWTEGTAPTRRFIMEYFGLRNYTAGTPALPRRTFAQIMFYETSGVVEMHIQQMGTGSKTIGLQNNDKTIGATVPGRNGFTTGISTPESWRFNPPTNYSFVWSPSTGLDTTRLTSVNYTPTSAGVKKINLQVTNPTTGCISNAPELSFTVNPTPTAPTVSGVLSVCGTGFTALTASEPGSGNSIKWYSDSLLTGLLQTGILYVTPVITQTTTYYAAQTSSTCSSPFTKVVVAVTTPDALTVTKPVLCAGTTSTLLTVTSNTAPYDTYIWSPITNLFIDAALTIPYQGSNRTSVYAGNLASGLTKYICSASSFSNLCSTKDSSMIYVQPSTPSVASTPSFICVRGVSTLTVSGTSAIAPKSVQWESSSDNITFSDIAGADSTSYKTDTLSTGKYFRAKIKSGDSGTGINSVCTTTASYFLEVKNPQPLSYSNGALCAVSGNVSMSATATAGSTFAWYISASSSTALSTSNTYAPDISANASYYLGVTQNGCEGTRVLVTASLSSPATLTATSAKIACNNGVSKIEVTSTVGNYDSYIWSPTTALFTDSACTTAYTGGSASKVFVKSSTAQLLTYTVNASNSVTNCTNSVTTTVRIMPSVTASASPAAVCITGGSTIDLTPSTIYGNVQWQSSANGSSYSNMSGETSTSLIIASISATTYYQAVIKDDANNTCATIPYVLTFSNPQADVLNSATRCGAGSLTLSAQAATDSVRWYTSASGGSALATGLSYTTPSISTTRTYYASYTLNGCQGSRNPVTATIASATAINVAASQTVCNDGVATLSVLSSLGNYTSYKWSSATNLYTDAAATVAYVAGANASTVYAKSSTAGLVTYQVVGINTTTTCTDTTTSDVIVMPASVEASASNSNLCLSGTSVINLTPSTGYGDGGIQWQISSNGSTGFTNISGASATSLTTDTITSTQYYQAVITNEAGATCLTTTPIAINVNNPQPSAVANGTRCGYGTVGLSVTATGTVNWYAVATGGSSIATGTAFATPAISATTTYYVSVTENGCEGTRSAVTATVTTAPTLTLSSSTNTVNCDAARVMVNVTSTVSDFSNYAWSPVANLYLDSTLTIPYTVGTSVDTVYINSSVAGTTTYSLVATDTTTGCANIATTSVTVNVVNPITVSPSTFNACNGAVVALSITSDTTNYGTYTWIPVTNLYSDAAATVAYAGESLTTVYVKSTTVGSVTYTVSGTSSGQACIGSARAQLFVLPASGTITSNAGSFCRTGSSLLTFNTSTTLPSGSIQWLSSTDGITYSVISGATGTTYNTGTITATTYYRVQVKNGNGDACFAADYTQTINNPTVVSTTPATRCGKGTVTLGATASSGATLSWYSVLTGGTVSGTGATFVTPSITATKTYYVSAAIGSCVSAPRTAVTATIGTASAITSTVSQSLVCAGSIATLSVTGTGYETYKWSPVTNLYSDVDGLNAYVAGTSANTVYFKSSTPGTSSYVVTANNASTSCSITSSKDVNVQATSATISSSKSTGICISGTAVLSLSASISLTAGTVQWESSSDNVTYATIASATSSTYTTATLTANKYYRALLKDGAGNICYTTAGYLQTVNAPSVTATTAASRCGTGTVNLSATPDALSTIKWYTALTGGSAIATTNSLTTPSIATTTTYYATAVIGTCESTPRTAVIATVQTSPAITVTANQTVCNNTVNQLTALTGAAEYTSLTWTPAINVYGDASASTPYTGGATVYVKRDSTGSKTYTLTAINTESGCNTSATSVITVLPASVTDSMTAVSPICKTGTASMTLLPATASLYPTGSIQWKSSINNSSFTNITGANSVTYSNATLDSTKYYYATISGTAGVCITTPTITYVVNNPKPTSVATPLTRCGVGTVSLLATADSGVVKWYNNSGTLLDSGYTYTTAVISASTTYSAGLTLSGCEGTRSTVTVTVTAPPALSLTRATDTVCNGAITTLSVSSATLSNFDTYTWSPISNLFTDASATVPYVAGTNFSTVYLKRTIPGAATYTVTGLNSTTNCANTTSAVINVQPAAASIGGSPSSLCISGTSALTLVPSSGFSAGTIQWQSSGDNVVYTDISGATNAAYGSSANTSTVYYKAIIKNRAGTTCYTTDAFQLKYSNPALTTPITEFVRCGSGVVTMTAQASVGDTIRWYANQNGGSALATGTTYVSPFILSSTTYYVAAENGACSTPRTAIVATTSTPPFLTVTSSQTVCNNQITPLSVTSNTADYTTYQWSPATNLFTDIAATTPYVLGASATTVYARTSTAGSRTYTINAVNTTAGCANSTTTTLSVQLSTATISANPTTLCFNGTAVLTMSPTSPYALGSIQWERSLDSITWLQSAGAVSTTYTTPLQADTRYYRAKVKDGAGNTCFTTAGFKLVANNPEITTTTPGTKCGTQTVTISATATAGSTIKWYSAISGGTALFTGASYTTPVLSATTNYYAEASVGTCVSPRIRVTATITPAPAITLTAAQNACDSSVKTVSVTSTLSNFESYVWTPVTNLYTDAAATVPYTTGTNASTVYFKRTTAGSTTYTVTASNTTTTCVNTATTTLSRTVVGITSATASPSSICNGTSAVLNASSSLPDNTYSWTNGATTSSTSVSPTTIGSNTYTVTVTDPFTGCFETRAVEVTVRSVPTAPTPAYSNQCGFGIPTAFIVSSDGTSGTFTWYSAPAAITTTYYNNDFSSSVGTATLGGNASLNASGYVVLTPNAASQVGGLTVDASGVNADSYEVSFKLTTGGAGGADGMSYNFADDANATATTPNAENGTGTKLVISFDDYGTAATATAPGIRVAYNTGTAGDIGITVGTNGVLGYSNNSAWVGSSNVPVLATINAQGKLNLSVDGAAIFSDLQLPAAFMSANKSTWKHVFKARTGALSMVHAIDDVNIQYSTTGLLTTGFNYPNAISETTNFYVSETVNGCEGPRVQVVAAVTPADQINISANDSSICVNSTVSLTANKAAGINNYTYTWSASPSTGSGLTNGTTGATVTATPTAAGTYVYTALANDSTCNAIASLTINVTGFPVIDSIKVVKSSVCNGDSALLSVYSNTISAGSQTLPTGYCSVANLGLSTISYFDAFSTTGATQNITNSGSGYTTGGFGDFTNQILIASPNQVVNFNTTLLGTTVGVAIWVDWNRNSTFETTERVYVTTGYVSTASGSFTVPANAVAGRTKMRIMMDYITSVPANPCAISTTGRGEVEDYSVSIISGVTQNPDLTYSWNPGGMTGYNVKVAPSTTTTYNVTATNAVGCSATSSNVTLTVNPIPGIPSGGASEQCGVGIPTATVSPFNNDGAPHIFKWYTAQVGGTLLQTDTSITSTYQDTLFVSDTLYVSEISAFGCEGVRAPVYFLVNTPDVIEPSYAATSNCLGNTFTLSANQVQDLNTYNYTWTASPSAGSGISGSASGDGVQVTPTVSGIYTYVLTAVDPDKGCVNVQSVSVEVTALPSITSVTISDDTICLGESITLAGSTNTVAPGNATLGTGTVVNGTTSYPTPFGQFYGANHEQYLVRASELTALGLRAGNITSVAWNLGTGYTGATLQNFNIKMAHTSQTAMTSTLVNSGFTDVLPTATYTPAASAGYSTITFANPFNWDGTSNVVLDVSFLNCSVCNTTTSCTTSYTTNGVVNQTATAYVSTVNFHADGNCTINSLTPSITGTTYSQRPNMRFRGQKVTVGAGSLTWTWTPVTIAGTQTSVTGNPLTLQPTTNTTYSVIATDANTGCSSVASSNLPVVVNPVPDVEAISLTPSTQCGTGVPAASVSGSGGTIKWYSAQTGGTLLQSGGSTYASAISTTTSFWIAESNGLCQTSRRQLVATVITPDPIDATSSAAAACPGATITLNVANISASPINNYSYSWTSLSGAAGALTVETGTTVTVSPITPGAYGYVVTANEASTNCSTTDTVYINAYPLPVIDSVRTSVSSICNGQSTTLSVFSSSLVTGPQTLPTGYAASSATSTSDDEIFNVTLNGTDLNNTSTCSTVAPGANSVAAMYSNFTTGVPVPTITAGASVSGSVTVGQCLTTTYTTGHAIFVDLDRSGTFETNERLYSEAASNSLVAGTVKTFSFTLPSTATAGVTLMRIVAVETTSGSSINPTGTYTWGETEDYKLNIIKGAAQNPLLTYTWTPGTATGANVSVSPTTNTTYSVTATNPTTGCVSAPSTVSVTVVNVGASASASASTVCSGSAVTLTATATGSGPFTYSWSNGSSVVGTTAVITNNPTSNTTYTVTVTDGCANSTTANVAVNATPLPSAAIAQTGTVEICSGNSQTLNATTDATSPSYQWTLNGTNIGGATSSSYTASATGQYAVKVTEGANGCFATSAATQVLVRSLPQAATFTPTNPSICLGGSISITGQSLQTAGGTVGTQDTTMSNNGNPYRAGFGAGNEIKTQMLVKASELTALGFAAGNITSLGFRTTAASGSLSNFSIKMGSSSANSLTTTFQTPTFTQVFSAATLTPTVGLNTHTFSTPFVWDGTSNVIIQVCQTNSTTGTITVAGQKPGYVANVGIPGATACSSTTGNAVQARPVVSFGGSNFQALSWSPSIGLNTTTGNTVVASPTETTVYTATATNTFGCTTTSNVTVTVRNPSTSTTTETVCNSKSWNGSTYTTSGVYTWTGVNAAGCDSVATLNLTVNYSSSSTTTESACNSFLWNGITYTTSGVKTFTTINAAGCDSVATLNLTIRNSSSSTTTQSACNSFSWNETTYTTSGVYTYNNINAAGCDSLETLNLTIRNSSSSTATESACNSYSWNGTNYTTSGVYTFNGTNAAGCDSVATLNLTIRYSSSSSADQTACNSYSWNGTTYTTSGVKTFTTPNAVGCDSVVTLNLTIRNSSLSTTTESVCNSYSWNGTDYTTSGVYTFNGTNAANCDSVATLNLTIRNSSSSSAIETACNSFSWNGTNYTTSGVYTFNGTNAANCDSVATLNLTIRYSSSSSADQTVCNSLLWNGTTYTTSGVYTFNGTNAAGCDSVATLNLTVNYSSASSTTESVCNSFSWNGTNYTTSGVYTFNGTNAAGCDSVATLNLTIRNSSSSSAIETACNSFSWNGTNYTTSGVYTFNTTNAAGCDSVATLNLTIRISSSSSAIETTCNSFLWNGTTYTASGVYTFNGTNAAGCDSVATLNLTVNYSSASSTTESVCNSFSWNGTNYTTSGVYTFNGTNAAGCDSVATLNLTIRNSSSSSASHTACNSYSWNGTTYTASGVYTFNGTNAAGCDSVATLNLTINNSSVTTLNISNCVSYVFNGNTYTTGGEYQYSTTNAAGCDSTVILNLIIKSPTSSSAIESVCNSFSWNGTNYTTSGVYTFNGTNTAGCDSLATLNLTIRNSSSSSLSDAICVAALPYVWNGSNYTATGVYTYVTPNAVGCDSTATLNLTVNTCTTTLNVTAFLEGFYTGTGTMAANLYDLGISTDATATDSVEVNLWSASNLSSATPNYSVKAVLHTNGTLTAVFPGATLNNSYYVALKHRNSIETWSAEPVTIVSVGSYDFSTSLSSAYSDGFNDAMKSVSGGKYAIYSGDVNQDGTVDLYDSQITENGAINTLFGYYSSDCNGDGSTDLFDLQLIENNSTLSLFSARP